MRPSRPAALGERGADVKENPGVALARRRAGLGERAAPGEDQRRMSDTPLPLVLLPGLPCDAALWTRQAYHPGRDRTVTGADLCHDDSRDLLPAIAARIPPARLAVIEECGHLSPLERPQAVTVLLRLWLEGALP
jgi:pimeloyl-ACP methyl ester carboxylesterase